MNAWKIVCATLVIFLAGIITGATLVRVAQGRPGPWRNPRPALNHPVPNPSNPAHEPRTANPGPQGLLSQGFVQALERQLQLTPEQREQIGRIMAGGQERMRELRARIDPEMRKELLQTREQIRAVLTPEQREQFEQMMKRPPRRGERGELPERRIRDPRQPGQPPPVEGEPHDSEPGPPPPNQ